MPNPNAALEEFIKACPASLVIVLISKDEMPERAVEPLCAVAEGILSPLQNGEVHDR